MICSRSAAAGPRPVRGGYEKLFVGALRGRSRRRARGDGRRGARSAGSGDTPAAPRSSTSWKGGVLGGARTGKRPPMVFGRLETRGGIGAALLKRAREPAARPESTRCASDFPRRGGSEARALPAASRVPAGIVGVDKMLLWSPRAPDDERRRRMGSSRGGRRWPQREACRPGTASTSPTYVARPRPSPRSVCERVRDPRDRHN